jgi:hypothetical protein
VVDKNIEIAPDIHLIALVSDKPVDRIEQRLYTSFTSFTGRNHRLHFCPRFVLASAYSSKIPQTENNFSTEISMNTIPSRDADHNGSAVR